VENTCNKHFDQHITIERKPEDETATGCKDCGPSTFEDPEESLGGWGCLRVQLKPTNALREISKISSKHMERFYA